MSILSTTLQQHHRSRSYSRSLVLNIGDGYLMENNLIFRNLRHSVIRSGYKFTTKPFSVYASAPMLALPDILKMKSIPYLNNVEPLHRVAKVWPRYSLNEGFQLLQKNYLFHESCHAYAHEVFKVNLHLGSSQSGLATERMQALQILMEEAYASSCEAMAWAIRGDVYEDLFLSLNTYGRYPRFLSKKQSSIYPIVFLMFFFSYLYSNFLYKYLGKIEYQRSLHCIARVLNMTYEDLKKIEQKHFQRAFKTGLTLNSVFRLSTSQFFFKMEGFKSSLNQLVNYDFMDVLESDARYLKSIEILCSSTLKKTKPQFRT